MVQDRGSPAYFVSVRKAGEKAEPVDLSHRVLSLNFVDDERKADKLTLTVDNFDLANFDDPVWAHGNILQFSFGYASGMAPVREAVIRKVKGGRQLSIEAHSKDVVMDRIKRREAYENMTRSEVVEVIAARNGYMDDTLLMDDTPEVFEIITQNNLTDAQMLRKLAHLEGKEFFVDFDGLHWHGRDLEQAPIRELIYYTDPEQGDIIDFDIENDITRKPARVRVKSRNPETGKTVTGLADNNTDTSRPILQETKALEEFIIDFDPESGAPISGTRQLAPTQTVAHEDDIPSNAQTETEAKTEAKRRYRKATQRAVKMTIRMVGDPNLVAKSVIKVRGMGTRLSGKYYVQKATSVLSGGQVYGMSLKLITDGYQRRYGSGKGSKKTDASSGALASAVAAVATTAASVDDSRVVSGASEIVGLGLSLVRSGSPSKAGLAELAKRSVRVAAIVKRVRKGSAGPQVQALTALFKALTALATLARRIANQEDVEAKGKLNTKEVADSRELQQRVTFDNETGKTQTTYVEARSRGKK